MWDYDIEKIKGHLINLPDFIAETPTIENKSKMLGLFPLFVFYESPELVEGYIKGACWARHTWYANTDAVECGVQIKFYVQEEHADQINSVLIKNRVDIDNDVIMFKGEGLESKLMAIYGDPRFNDVDWLFQIDCDLFAFGEQIDFFNAFQSNESEGIGVIDLVHVDHARYGPGRTVMNGMQEIVESPYRKEWDEFVDVLVELGCSHLINKFLAIPPEIPCPIPHMIAAPMNRLNDKDKAWLYRAGQLMYGEQVILSVFNIDSRFANLWSFKGSINTTFRDWAPAYPPRYPHIGHIADTRTEYVFRDKIGVIDD